MATKPRSYVRILTYRTRAIIPEKPWGEWIIIYLQFAINKCLKMKPQNCRCYFPTNCVHRHGGNFVIIFFKIFFFCLVSDWGSRLYDVLDFRNTGQQQPWWGCETFFLLFYFTCLLELKVAVEREKSLRHVAMVVKFLDDNKPKTSLEKWIHTLSKFIDLIQFHLSCQMLGKFSGV